MGDALLALASKTIQVGSYTRKDGTRVRAYTRKSIHLEDVLAKDLKPGDIVIDRGRAQVVEKSKTVLGQTILQVRDSKGQKSQRRAKAGEIFKRVVLALLAAAVIAGTIGSVAAQWKMGQAGDNHTPDASYSSTNTGGHDGSTSILGGMGDHHDGGGHVKTPTGTDHNADSPSGPTGPPDDPGHEGTPGEHSTHEGHHHEPHTPDELEVEHVALVGSVATAPGGKDAAWHFRTKDGRTAVVTVGNVLKTIDAIEAKQDLHKAQVSGVRV